jgi:site-specific recombinase XerD
MNENNQIRTLEVSIQNYIELISTSRSENTARAYGNAMKVFAAVLEEYHFPIQDTPAQSLPEDAVAWLAGYLKTYSSATERLYLTAVAGFYEYLAAERLAEPNLPRVRLLIRQRSRRPGQRLPQFPQNDIEKVIEYALDLTKLPVEHEMDQMRNLRDRAFLITLAETGLRVHEACNLRRGDIDWNEGRAIIIGKGDRQAVVRFSRRSMSAVKDYLAARAGLDGASGKPLAALPLFARHDRGAGKKVKQITTATGRNIVSQRVSEALGPQAVGTITPHSFRHYFVTTVLRGSGGNLKLAQDLARHRNIAVTQRYAHLTDEELDLGYWKVFESSD